MAEQTSVPTWPEDPGWRIRSGAGLIRQAPISDEMARNHAREDEREARQAEFEAEIRRQQALERRWDLERQGYAMRSSADVIAAASFAQDRSDRRQARSDAEWEAAQINPQRGPSSTALLAAAKAERQAHKAAAEATPASEAALGRAVEQLKNSIHNTFGKRPY